jgi:glycosyltransferase involved in cell wall biosynthesis
MRLNSNSVDSANAREASPVGARGSQTLAAERPLRVVVYPHALTVGGSQLNAIELAAAARDRGHYVTVFAAEPGILGDTVERLRLPLVIAPSAHRRPSIAIARALRDLCRRERVDIVHGYEWPPCLEAFYGPLLLDGITVGCTIMSMAVAPFIPSSIPLIVGTEQIAAAARTSRRARVRVIEPPVDTDSNHPNVSGDQFRARYGLEDRLTIVLVSRLSVALKLEGIERAIAAAALLAGETGLRLVLVGEGPERERLARAAARVNSLTGEPTVTLTGELVDPRSAYAAADVVLGMGGSALRAMAFAKPVVVLGELGFAELLTPHSAAVFLWQGFYGLGDGDTRPERLAELLRPLLANRDTRARLGVFSREFVESRFSLFGAANRQVDFYREWLTERPGQSRLTLEAASTAAQLFSYKVRRRLARWKGRQATEDFNAVSEIVKTAEQARKSR